MTQKKLASASGVPYSTVNGWATGAATPRDVDQLVAVGVVLADWAGERALSVREWDRLMAADRIRPVATRPPSEARGQPPAAQIRVGVIPRSADCFQDRAVADRVRATIDEGGWVVQTQTTAHSSTRKSPSLVMVGMGGVGKTQLAAAYARYAWEQGVELLVWVNAATRDSVVSAYSDAAVRLSLPLADRDDTERSAREFVTWAEITQQRWLVVLDDVQAQGDLRGLWPPVSATGMTVVTTRRRDLAPPRSTTIKVGLFSSEEADAYLRSRLIELATDHQERMALIEDLDHLPLALAQAAAYMLQQDMDCGRYCALLAQRLLADAVPAPEDLFDDHQKIVSAVWEISIDRADQARPAGLARQLIRLASVLDPHGIPAAVLTSQVARDCIEPLLPKANGITGEAIDQALRLLHRYSLIEYDRTATDREVRIHQLVQRATRENLPVQPSSAPSWAAVFAALAATALLTVWPEVEDDQFGHILRSNTIALQKIAGADLWTVEAVEARVYTVLLRAAESLGETGQVTAAVTAYSDLCDACLRYLGPAHFDTLAVRRALAYWRDQAGDVVGAAAAFEAVLADLVRVVGPDHPATLQVRNNLAVVQGKAGDAMGAFEALAELAVDQARVLGVEHPLTLSTFQNLASWSIEAADAATADATTVAEAAAAPIAAGAFETLLEMQRRALGPDHPSSFPTRSNQAIWRGKAGDAAGAAGALAELLDDQIRVLGPDHPDTWTTRNNLATMRGRAGDAAGAADALVELLDDMRRRLGPNHPITLTISHNLTYWQMRAASEG
ncbi:tetratricopeptide repeat protein [Spirillospora sp. NPDC048823]|uniref:tetratricopeptide repeat protein n=1 Tax=unclassified Spirillospora TaxID=2642701 RepID=UPI0037138253